MPLSWSVRIISSPVLSPTCASRFHVWPPKALCIIFPSLVLSKRAPQCSSSLTRSGASWACSSAMRQLFSIFPPCIVSWKWTFQSSWESKFASAAATPPSAMTVWALPRSDLQTSPTEAPCADASIAARRPAPPAPITMTSCVCVSYFSIYINLTSVITPLARRNI